MKEFTVFMEHTMRSVQTVVAENEDEAKRKAYNKSFNEDEANGWEEIDTEYWRVDEGKEIPDDEEG